MFSCLVTQNIEYYYALVNSRSLFYGLNALSGLKVLRKILRIKKLKFGGKMKVESGSREACLAYGQQKELAQELSGRDNF